MNVRVWLVSLTIGILTVKLAHAKDYKRVEVLGSYERLSPSLYGERKVGTFSFFHKPLNDFTYFITFSGFSRKEGDAMLWSAGAYKDWTSNFYTYTSISHGTNSVYLPKIRFDLEAYPKLGPAKNIVPAIGFSYVKYHKDIYSDTIFPVGLTYYGDGWNITYKHFINISNPGSVKSSSDLISIGIGREKHYWTYLDLSYGKQAYLATHVVVPVEVRQNTLRVGLNHRRWINNYSGFILGADYFKLENGYEKYGFSFGLFKEF